MPFDPDYSRDTEFTKLLGRRGDVDLTVAALELARDADADLDFQPTLDWISACGGELSGPVAKARTERDALEALRRCLAETHGLFGDEESYSRAESSYLNRVIETGRGIPISLSVLYIAVARQVHIELGGIGAPMHFLSRCETSEGPLYVDAYTHGRIMNRDECVEWLRSLTKLSGAKLNSALKPVSPRTIIIRMLNNLKAVHARQEAWDAACRVQHRLMSLQPASYAERRDFGVIALKANHSGQSLEVLTECLKTCPKDEREMLAQHIDEAKRQLARWN